MTIFTNCLKSAAILLAGSLILAAPASANSSEAGSLTVIVTGAQAGQGPLYLTVQTKDQYKMPVQSAGGIYKDIAGGTLTYVFDNIAAGDYAISLWHDLDSDGQFSMSENYMPADGWGTSGAPDMSKVPTFDDVKVTVGGPQTSETVAMIYPN